MDQWKPSEGFYHSAPATQPEFSISGSPSSRLHEPCPEPLSQQPEQDVKNCFAARKVQKADREKLRRDRLNEQFLELGTTLDPDRPKNDKATILTDTILMLKDLTAQVSRLKAEYASLSEESRELTQEKNELREEKAALKSDIDSLSAQYQQRLMVMYPWATMDPSMVMGPPPSYAFPVPLPIPPGAIPVPHPSMQLYPFFRTQNPGNPCTTYVPYSSSSNPQVEQTSTQHIPSHPQPSSKRCQSASHQDTRSWTSDKKSDSVAERSEDFSNVATELELKTPGSAALSPGSDATHEQEHSSGGKKAKHWSMQKKGSSITDASCSSRCSSSTGLPDSSASSVGDGSVADKKC